jgi:hypothetical protein
MTLDRSAGALRGRNLRRSIISCIPKPLTTFSECSKAPEAPTAQIRDAVQPRPATSPGKASVPRRPKSSPAMAHGAHSHPAATADDWNSGSSSPNSDAKESHHGHQLPRTGHRCGDESCPLLDRQLKAKLNMAIQTALGNSQLKVVLAHVGVSPRGSSPQQGAEFVKAEYEKWKQVVVDGNIKTN